jgi:hypothetical protein
MCNIIYFLFQRVRVVATQLLDVGVTTIGVEMVVAPIMDVVRKGILIGSITILGSGLGEV